MRAEVTSSADQIRHTPVWVLLETLVLLGMPACGDRSDENKEAAPIPSVSSGEPTVVASSEAPPESAADTNTAVAHEQNNTGPGEIDQSRCPVDLETVQAVFGMSVVGTKVRQAGSSYGCSFARMDGPGAVDVHVSTDGKPLFLTLASMMPDNQLVDDLGELAFYSAGETTLVVLTQGKVLHIQLGAMGDVADVRGKTIALARTTIPRL